MAKKKEKAHPINDFFRRVGLTLIVFAIMAASVALLYIVFHLISFSCPIKELLGHPCPGCGMTRAAASLLTFDFKAAWNYNPVIYYLVLWVGVTAARYLIWGNYKKIMSVGWILVLVIPWLLAWFYLTFVK